jgi:hypothetical protein
MFASVSMTDDPKIIQSELTRTIEAEGTSVGVLIYRHLGEIEWTLEVFDLYHCRLLSEMNISQCMTSVIITLHAGGK